MKKVFSVKKFEKWLIKIGKTKDIIERDKESWANDCNGKTKEEMLEMGLGTCDDWMIVVEEI